MTRNGKIARLPNDLRDQLNCRIRDGEPGKSLLRWLNGLPEVKALLKAEFANHPIAPSNLSEWKNGGYLDWLARQDALALVNDLQEQSAPGSPNFDQALNDKLARWASIQYAATARNLIAAETDPLLKWSRLCQLCGAIARLRRIELFAERISIERQWLAIEQAGADKQREEDG